MLVQGPGHSEPLADGRPAGVAPRTAARRGHEGRVLLIFLSLCLFLVEHEFQLPGSKNKFLFDFLLFIYLLFFGFTKFF